MSVDEPKTGLPLGWKLLLLALVVGVLGYFVAGLLSDGGGSLRPYDGFN